MSGAGARATVVSRKVERLVVEGRAERALEVMREMLEMLVSELSKPAHTEQEKLALRELTARHMGRAEDLKRMVAARPKGVGGALQLLTSGLRRQLGSVKDVAGAGAGAGLPEVSRLQELDLAGLLSVCIGSWRRLPWGAGSEGALTRSMLHEMRHWRNAWAHQRLVSPADTFRAIDTVQRILEGCQANDYAGDCAAFFRVAALKAIELR
jgi:hypothetical protein|eukprot:m.318870 g.318870  ORF g.318870 m.318870 type:complete len:210 (+) comp27577_c0_seq2:52-681(+)